MKNLSGHFRSMLALFCCLVLLINGNAQAQTLMPIPAGSTTYSGYVRGYWFTAPGNFTITGLRVSPEASTGTQSIQVIKINDATPVLFSTISTNITTLYYVNNATNGVIQNVNIPVAAGDIIGILGQAGTVTSYSAASSPFSTTINGQTVSLHRFISQTSINTAATVNYSTEASGAIGRIEMYYSANGCLAPTGLAASNITTTGATLNWNAVAGSSGYEYVLDQTAANPTGSGTATTNTSYTASSLTPSTTYYMHVRNNCGLGNYSSWTTISFTTACAPPAATITASGPLSICTGNAVSLNANTSTGYTYQWKQGGTNISGATNSTYSATTTGSYTVTVTSAACSTTSAATVVTVNPLPTATITTNGATTFCTGSNVVLSVPTAANQTYQWSNGPTAIALATNNTYTASTTGNYTVSVTNSTTGCSAVSATPVNVIAGSGPAATITPAGSVSFCPGGNTTLTANTISGISYQWQLNGVDIPSATNASYIAAAVGNYTVKASSSPSCFTITPATSVTQYSLPNVTTTPAGSVPVCQNSTMTISLPTASSQNYQWKLAGNNIAGATNSTYATGTAGNYTVTVTNTTTGCAATSASVNVIVNPLPPAVVTTLNPATVTCEGDTIWFSANTGYSSQWNRNGSAISGVTGNAYGATVSGSYTLTTTDNNGCSNTSAPVVLTFNPRPHSVVVYTSPLTFCVGGAVVLSTLPATGMSYQWQNNGVALPGATDSSFIASQNGSYAVKMTNSFGCSDLSSPPTLVAVNQLPTPTITRTGNTLATGSYSSYQWLFDNTAIPGATNQSYMFTQDGGYSVDVVDANGCTGHAAIQFINNVGVAPLLIQKDEVKLYPNPASSKVYIEAPAPVTVKIFDMQGLIISKYEAVREIDITNLANGYYMCLILDSSGRMIKTEKLIRTE